MNLCSRCRKRRSVPHVFYHDKPLIVRELKSGENLMEKRVVSKKPAEGEENVLPSGSKIIGDNKKVENVAIETTSNSLRKGTISRNKNNDNKESTESKASSISQSSYTSFPATEYYDKKSCSSTATIFGCSSVKPGDGESTHPTMQKSEAGGLSACVSRKKAIMSNGGKREMSYLGLINEQSHSTEYYKLYTESQVGFTELADECVRDCVLLFLLRQND